MPTREYTCQKCGYTFKQVVLRGEEKQPVSCRQCGEREVKPLNESKSLFEGISNFSALASDTD